MSRAQPIRQIGPLVVWRASGRTKLHEEGRCRMCERSAQVRKLTRHHLVPQRWFHTHRHDVRLRFVRSCDNNIVPLCRPCHDAIETDVVARRILRKLLASQEVALCIYLRGSRWFDAMYPPSHRRPGVRLAA